MKKKEPKNVLAFWFAIDDANIQNACLWGVPASHKTGLFNRWEKKEDGMEFVVLNEEVEKIYKEEDMYVPLEVKKGTVILFDGLFIHKSYPNRSKESREAYTLHFFDGIDSWSKKSWLQRDGIEKLSEYWQK